MKAPPGAHAAGQARRAEYLRLRCAGLTKWDAARQLGMDVQTTINRYERWHQAGQRGEVITPAKGNR